MKKIDRLLMSSVMGPFAVSFGIALFVLIMQFLWLYIDEIAGKGVSVFVLVELIGYLSISTFPMALPIAVLIASVMVMGNLSERYELSSMKSAGISLLRVMRGLIICAAGVALLSYICSDFLIPISNLKFRSRLYDIRKQKPALTLEKGIFNEDFRQFVIRIGDKAPDGETISQVMIEDQTNAGRLKFNQILADSGQMYTTDDKRYFVMNLFNGTQYQEPGSGGTQQKQKYPFIRTNFKSFTKIWDMKEFEMTASDIDRFKNQRSMLSMNQLRFNMDSLTNAIKDNRKNMAIDLGANLNRIIRQSPSPISNADSLAKANQAKNAEKMRLKMMGNQKQAPPLIAPAAPKPFTQEINKPLDQYEHFYETFKAEDRPNIVREARTKASLGKSIVITQKNLIENRSKEYVKTGYELFTKYSFALVCFIFLFIGAPMGAIIRKGGFGYPVLVSITFFVTYIMLTILCRKLAESYIMTPFWAAMMPCLILVPAAVFLTRKAMNDSQILNFDGIEKLIKRIQTFKWKNTAPK
jgi:lipopolysaccharide export system permease protein